MFGLAVRGFNRALITRCTRTATMATHTSSTSAAAATVSRAVDISKPRAGETEVVLENFFFINDSTTPGERTIGIRWRPGMWDRCKAGDQETTQALKQKFKNGTVTIRDLSRLFVLGLQMVALFVFGSLFANYRHWGDHFAHPWRGVEIEYFDAPDPDAGSGHH